MIELDRIYNEDCLEGMKRIPDGSVDMVLCDLPYGTTAIACINANRRFIGFETDSHYWQLSQERIAQALEARAAGGQPC